MSENNKIVTVLGAANIANEEYGGEIVATNLRNIINDSNINRCPTKQALSMVVIDGKTVFQVNGSYANNQLVKGVDVSLYENPVTFTPKIVISTVTATTSSVLEKNSIGIVANSESRGDGFPSSDWSEGVNKEEIYEWPGTALSSKGAVIEISYNGLLLDKSNEYLQKYVDANWQVFCKIGSYHFIYHILGTTYQGEENNSNGKISGSYSNGKATFTINSIDESEKDNVTIGVAILANNNSGGSGGNTGGNTGGEDNTTEPTATQPSDGE